MHIGTGVYILECSNGRYYIGSTDDIARRLAEHDAGISPSTRNILPVKLTFFQNCSTLLEARRLERKLKAYKNRRIIEKIIRDGFIRAASSVG